MESLPMSPLFPPHPHPPPPVTSYEEQAAGGRYMGWVHQGTKGRIVRKELHGEVDRSTHLPVSPGL